MSSPEELRPARKSSPAPETARTKKACDLCRSRKIKCRIDDNASVCHGCRDLDAPCTHSRPRRRRGPPNKHVLAATTPQATFSPLPVSPGEVPSPSRASGGDDLNKILASLGPTSIIFGLLDDWFRFVHPLAPILHRQELLQRLHLRLEDCATDQQVFGALVISVCAVTISTLRRKSFESYPDLSFGRCIEVIEQGNLLQSRHITLDWCIAWYNIASAIEVADGVGSYRSYRAIREAMTGVNWLLGYVGGEQTPANKECLKRLYWLLYMWQVGAELQGQPHLTFLPFNQNLDHLRPKDITDRQLHPELAATPVAPDWPEDELYFVPGLNNLVDVFLTWEESKKDLIHKPPEQTLQRAISRIQSILDNLAPCLRWTGGLTRYPEPAWGHQCQMVNILITALSLKSNFLQHLGSLIPGLTQYHIVCDVLEILDHLPQPVFEVNGHSLVVKIRDIGAGYLSELNEGSKGGTEYAERQAKVHQVLQALEKLDFRPYPETDIPTVSMDGSHLDMPT